jgi:hypothetical protein
VPSQVYCPPAGGRPKKKPARGVAKWDRSTPGPLTLVAWGMDRELREVFGLVRSRLEEIAEEEGDEDTD